MSGVAHKVVVVGGGIAGVSTVAALRAGGYDGSLTLVDAGGLPHDRPPLSKDYLAGRRGLEQIALQPPEWYDTQSVRLVTRARVTALRPASGQVELADGTELPADRVVLATGGSAARPPIPGARGSAVHVLRTVDDADRLREALPSARRVLVVGAGLIGAEVASTLAGLGCDVVLADPVARPLSAAVGPDLAAWLHDQHRARGIHTVAAGLATLTHTSSGVEAALVGEGRARVVDLVVLGVGMVSDTGLAEAAGLDVDRGVLVDAGQRTSNPAVLAVGDATRARADGTRVEHWDAARSDGECAAATLLGRPAPARPTPWFWSDRHGRHVEVVGRMADADHTVARGCFGDEPFAVFGLRGNLVVGAASVDDGLAARTARRLVAGAIPVDAAQLADPSTNLRRLLRGG
ncbi:Reductase C-terminal [Parafrankia irregularis]|uniref:Reductase C-terminal n=1 Tax=Parafrankia irregularis TaxID=795642 RepID=A0A0S4QHV2_9ACTN|nr:MULTISPECIES: FAD-dependent oxidoreductase [Parafrankia]MBE3204081.1 FAD-dependent oxidoreductase [Parafrankia sp. CH37]CUU55043.1 Reductase C-terminal [Parafrankia irregularis]